MEKSFRIWYWAPRILGILLILLVSMFAFDAFAPELTFWQQLVAFAMHMIPSFILLAILLVAWRWDYIGAIIYLLLGIGVSPYLYIHNFRMNHSVSMSLGVIMILVVPIFVIGVLFFVSSAKKRKMQS